MVITNREYLEELKAAKKMKRSFDDYLNYFILIFPVGISLIGAPILLGSFTSGLDFRQLLIAFVSISVGILFSYFSLLRLNQNISFETIENANKLGLADLKHEIESNFRLNDLNINEELEFIEAWTELTGFSWGEKITIIKDGNTYLVNSRPSGKSQPVTIYKDRQNIKRIKYILT